MRTLLNTITCGDAKELAKQIPDESIDLIFTDPPYPTEYLHLYEWLAVEAKRVLKPGGFLISYSGQYSLGKIMSFFSAHLSYYWMCAITNPGANPTVWSRGMTCCYKPILIFSNGDTKPLWYNVLDQMQSHRDKRFHDWGQAECIARYYVERFSREGDIVFEPFTGGGTTAVVCKQINRNFIGFELDTSTADIARKRIEAIQPLLIPELPVQALLEVSA